MSRRARTDGSIVTQQDNATDDAASATFLIGAGGLTTAAPITQIVFIEANAPDAALLARGVQTGVQAVLLNPAENGVAQIASYLSSHNISGLTGIDIVAHGADGALSLGTATLTSVTIASYAPALATIGSALSASGTIQLYGCDVAQDASGVAFIEALSTATGGANIAAASHLVGSANQGGSWTLDVTAGTDTASTPFTASTLAAYQGELAAPSISDIYTYAQPTSSNSLASIWTPTGNLTKDSSGNIYGVTVYGGSKGDGTVYELAYNSTSQTYAAPTTIASINSPDGTSAAYGVTFDSSGDMFGATARANGTSGFGSIYELVKSGASYNYTTIFSFNNSAGLAEPDSQPILDSSGNIYGTNYAGSGGTGGLGLVYELVKSGASYTEKTLVTFTGATGNAPGNDPMGTLYRDSSGDLFGTTTEGGSGAAFYFSTDGGVAYELVYNASNQGFTYQVLYNFNSSSSIAYYPISGLVADSSGNLFGTTEWTTVNGTQGGIYELVKNGSGYTYQNLAHFDANSFNSSFTDVTAPYVTLTVDSSGNLWGVGESGGDSYSDGGIFELKKTGGSYATNVTTVLPFDGVNGSDGSLQDAQYIADSSLIFGANGNLIGTTDGANQNISGSVYGTIYQVSGTGATPIVTYAAPTVTAGATATFTGGSPGTAVALDSGLTITAGSSTTLAGATVTLANYHSGDTLNFTTQNGISAASNTGGVLTLTGTATVAQYQTALDSITYSFTSGGDPTIGNTVSSHSISWVVNDGTSSTTAVTSTLNETHAAPVLTAVGSGAYTLGGSAVAPETIVTASAPDSGGTLASAKIQITNNFSAGDTLNFTQQNGISGSYNSTTGVLTLSGTATVSNYVTALDSITFSTTNTFTTTRTVGWTINDGVFNSTAQTTTVNIVSPPHLTAGATVSFAGGDAAVVADGGLSINAGSSSTITAATVSISNGYLSGDTLGFTAQNGIIGSYNNGTLSLTGSATAAQYQAALDSITYGFTGTADPTSAGSDTSRTLSWTVTDANSQTSAAVTSTVNVAHTAATVTAGASASYIVGSTTPALDSSLTVTDPDSGGNLTGASVTISGNFQTGDALSFTNQNGITGSYNATTGVLTLSGTATVAQYQTMLDGITFSSTANSNATRTISWVANDGVANSTAVTSTVTVSIAQPSLNVGTLASYAGGSGSVVLTPNLTLSDVSSPLISSADVHFIGGIQVTGDTLAFVSQYGITGSFQASGDLFLNGTATLAQYQTVLQSVTYSFSPSNGDPTAGGSHTSRTIGWIITPQVGSNLYSSNSTLNVSHTAPTLTAGATVSYVSLAGAVALDSGLTTADADSGGNLSGATIKINTGYLAGDALNFTNQNGITGSYSAGTLTLTGTATLAQYQAALESISFSSTASDTTNGGADSSRGITWTVTDGVASSTTANSTVNVDTAPSVVSISLVDAASNTGGTEQFTVTFSKPVTGASISDFTLAKTGATVGSISAISGVGTKYITITASGVSGAGTLGLDVNNSAPDITDSFGTAITTGYNSGPTYTITAASGTPSITVPISTTNIVAGQDTTISGVSIAESPTTGGETFTAVLTDSNGTLASTGGVGTITPSNGNKTLTITGTLAQVNTDLAALTDTNSTAGADNISVSLTDSNSATATPASILVNVQALPVVTAGANPSFSGGGAAVTADSGLAISDASSSTITGASISIGSGFLSGDTLGFATQNGITGSYNSSTGVLTLSGSATAAQYQTALDSITYGFSPSNGDATNGGGDTSRTLSWTVTDANSLTSTASTSTVAVAYVAPTLTAGASVNFTQGGAAVVADSGLAVTDPDSGGNLTGATIHISNHVTGDTLHFTTQNGITGSYSSGSGTLLLSGTATVAQYQAALESITFSTTAASTTARSIGWTVTDGTGSATGVTSTVNVLALPVVTAGANPSFSGGGAAVTADGGLTVTDTSSSSITGASVSISSGYVSGDTLGFSTQNGISGVYSAGTLTLSGTATLAQYQTALDSITYGFTAGSDPTNGGSATSRTLSWSVTDANSNTSTASTSSVNVSHTAPTLTAGASASYTLGGSAVVADSGLTTSDSDSSGNLSGATVKITGNFVSGDTLAFSNTASITGSYNSGNGTLTLSGTATVAQYQAALQSISFSTTATSTSTRTLSWSDTDGVGTSSTATSTISIGANPPAITAGAVASFAGGGAAVTADSGLAITDTSSSSITGAAVSISSGYVSGDTLGFSTQNGISGVYSAGTLTLSGTATLAQYQTALDSITYGFTGNGDPTNGGSDTARTLSWTVTDGNSNTSTAATSTVSVSHTAATVTAGTAASYTLGGSASVVDSGLTVTDPDSGGTLTGATVSIGSGFASGDSLTFSNTANITGSYNTTTGVLTLSGSDTLAHYQAALESITFSSTATSTATRSLSWVANDGVASSSAVTSSVNVSAAALGTIAVTVFGDTNANGTQDTGETGLAGVTVNLLTSSGASTGIAATTNASGVATFSNVAAGSYQVSVVAPTGDYVSGSTNVGTAFAVTGGVTSMADEGLYTAPALKAQTLNLTATEGQSLGNIWATILANVVDPNPASLTLTSINTTGTYGYTNLVSGSRSLLYIASGIISTPTYDTFTYTAKDGAGNTITGTVSVDVTGTPGSSVTVDSTPSTTQTASGPGTELISQGTGQTLNGAAGGNTQIYGGTDTKISAQGNGNTIVVDPGSHSLITMGANNNTLTTYGVAGTTNTISASGTGNVVNGGDENESITGSKGSWTINAGNGTESITIGSTLTTSTAGGNTITLGNGSGSSVKTYGANNTITVGNGSGNIIVAGSSAGTAGHEAVTVGNGSNTITTYGGNANVTTGTGSNTITISGNSNTVTNNGGLDTINTGSTTMNTFIIPTIASAGEDIISGTSLVTNNTFNLVNALSGTDWNGTVGLLGNYITLVQSGANTLVDLSATSGGTPVTLIQLNATTAPSLATFLAHAVT